MNATYEPVFPDVRIALRSGNRWAVAATLRQALRRAGKDGAAIDRMVGEIVAAESPDRLRDICRRWVTLKNAG